MSKETLRFEEAMLKLEGIVQKLESGDVPLEDAITLYKARNGAIRLLSRKIAGRGKTA